ncbi:MAG: hypothetical protein L6R39_006529 [Caloplaca ligustica]|nr:MAG: hypothetical protein L6R39_006529 [Caloplaca ligustica]
MVDASGSGSESDPGGVEPENEALDLDGSKLLDSKGRGMVKVCEDEDENDIHVKQEMDEMHDLDAIQSYDAERPRKTGKATYVKQEDEQHSKDNPEGEGIEMEPPPDSIKRDSSPPAPAPTPEKARRQTTISKTELGRPLTDLACRICSMANEPSALVCGACSNVLQPQLMPGHWRCQTSACHGTEYTNAGDCGVCGVCGGKKPRP